MPSVMNRLRIGLVLALATLLARTAAAASLQQVSSWGASGVPTYIAMYIYVPDKLATNPPILVVSHYCGGDAAGVFGEAQGGGIVAAADKYGFIMIFPQNHLPGTTRNCWDVGSKASLTHDGGGDTQAIAQMVKYTLSKYNANPDRVYATGTSSGAMMTEALLAVYPDVFKGGSEFSGVPAGCWADQYASSNQWSGPCAGGTDTMSAQAWGDLARGMDPGYTGHRPRVQLWHGTADPTINYANQTEAIKQWTNVLGLSTNPTTTTTVTLSSHSWTRQSWQDACGYVVLDAWAEQGGPHGTDANFNSTYVIPFLALDQTGDVDPEIAMCGGGAGGKSGTGTAGHPGTSGSGGAGGMAAGTGGAAGGAAAGAPGSGGHAGTGGALGRGGTSGTGGMVVTGTAGGSGGASTGGSPGSGGVTSTGGSSATSTGGSAASGSGGSPGTGGSSETTDSSGCSCGVGPHAGGHAFFGLLALAGLVLARGRRRARRPRP